MKETKRLWVKKGEIIEDVYYTMEKYSYQFIEERSIWEKKDWYGSDFGCKMLADTSSAGRKEKL